MFCDMFQTEKVSSNSLTGEVDMKREKNSDEVPTLNEWNWDSHQQITCRVTVRPETNLKLASEVQVKARNW